MAAVAGLVGLLASGDLDGGRAVEAAGMSPRPLDGSGVNRTLTPKRRRREVETSAWVGMFPRLLRAWVRRAQGDGDLDALAALARHREDVDAHLADMVTVLRNDWAYSWQEIADALGCSRQAAQQRWHKAGGARRPGGQPGSLR